MNKISTMELRKQAEQFYLLAADYCAFIEKNVVTEFNVNEFTLKLLQLYISGIKLPEIDELPDEELDEYRPSHKHRVQVKVRTENYFWIVFNPYEQSSLCQSSISDALEDIYMDLKDGMECYEKGFLTDALFYWKLNLNFHWGNHLVEVLKPLYYLQSDMKQ